MQSSILAKLEKELEIPIQGEPQTLYILAEIRKYIEEYESSKKTIYQNLYFFCDWVLHIKMNRKATILLLKKFEDDLGEFKTKTLKEIARDFITKEGAFYMFVWLMREMEAFLNAHSLPKKIIEEYEYWDRFTFFLVKILMDSPLVSQNGIITKFSFVAESDERISFRISVKNKGSVKIILKNINYKLNQKLGYRKYTRT